MRPLVRIRVQGKRSGGWAWFVYDRNMVEQSRGTGASSQGCYVEAKRRFSELYPDDEIFDHQYDLPVGLFGSGWK